VDQSVDNGSLYRLTAVYLLSGYIVDIRRTVATVQAKLPSDIEIESELVSFCQSHNSSSVQFGRIC